jgi:hypothetical protein
VRGAPLNEPEQGGPGGQGGPEGDVGGGPAGPPSEEELRARLEEELQKIRVQDVLLQTVITLVNLGGQRLGLTEATRERRDLGEARVAIEAVRALLPLLQASEIGDEPVRAIQDALAQLQMAYAREVDAGEGPGGPGPEPGGGPGGPPPAPGAPPGPASGQGRRGPRGGLWVPPGSGT